MNGLMLDTRNRISKYSSEGSFGVSREANFEKTTQEEILSDYFSPVSRKTPYIEFLELTLQWKEETVLFSSVIDICMHPAYQRIIGMGTVALYFIFSELKVELNHWFWALKMITGIDPVPPKFRGNMEEMRKIWITWAKDNGYL